MEDHPLRSHGAEASHREGVLPGGGEEAKLFPAQRLSRARAELGRKLVLQWVAPQGQGSNAQKRPPLPLVVTEVLGTQQRPATVS